MPALFLYARKSTEEDDRQVASIPAQLTDLRALAKSRGFEIAREFEESQSARHPGRPIFNEMMKEIEKRSVHGILCWKPDRLARNAVDGGQVIYALDRNKLQEIVCPGHMFRNTADDKLLLGLEFTMSKKYVDDLSDNVRRGNRAVLSSGRMPGNVPIGYLKELPADRTRGRGAGRTIPDPERFPLVRAMFEKFLSGTATATEVFRFAKNELNLRTRGTRRFPSRPISISAVYDLLQNPFYMGLIRFGGDVFPGDHEAMLNKEEFDRVQALLHRNDRPRPSARTFTYRGLLKCTCGRGVTAELHRKPSGLSFTYYRCSRRWKDPVVCARPFLPEPALETRIQETFQALAVPERFVRQALRRLDAMEKRANHAAEAAHEARVKEVAVKDREIARLMTLCLRDAVSEEEFVAEKTKLLAEKAELVARLSGPPQEVVVIQKVREIIVAAAEAPRAFTTADAEERRRLTAALCESLILSPKGINIQLAVPFRILAGTSMNAKNIDEGANRTSVARKLNVHKVKPAFAMYLLRSSRRIAKRRGANPSHAKEFALNQNENRALAGVQATRFSTWWTLTGSNR